MTQELYKKGEYILVTTSHKGVFVGEYCASERQDDGEETFILLNCRMVIYWPDRGVMSLQTRTDLEDVRLSDASPGLKIPFVDASGPITPEAEKALREAPTYIQ